MFKHSRQWEHRPNGLLQQHRAKGNTGPRVFNNQRERWPRGLPQHNAKGNTGPVVFTTLCQKGTPAQLSFTTQYQKGTSAQWSFTTQCQNEHWPSGLLLCL
jgi:hypothetical protein